MFGKQALRSSLQVLATLTLAVAMTRGQEQPIGKPMFASPAPEADAAAAITPSAASTIPHWTNSFLTKNKNYSYSMVGASPFTSPSTSTTIDTELQPLVFKFSNGKSISGTEAATAIANSPIFVNTKFPTGTGQYADEFQRANFGRVIGSKPYHVLLGLPHIRPALVINVPKGSGTAGKTKAGIPYGVVNYDFVTKTITGLVKSGGFNAATLPVFVAGNVFEYQQISALCCILGFHNAYTTSAGQTITYVYTSYPSSGLFNAGFADTAVLSHEVAEWMDDPFGTNIVAPWAQPQNLQICFSDLLEVGDAIEAFPNANFTVMLNGNTYHVQDQAFFSWFARQTPSIGAGGRYSYLSPAKLTKAAPICN